MVHPTSVPIVSYGPIADTQFWLFAETGHRYPFFDPPDPTRRIHPKTDHIKEILKLSRLDSFSESSTTSRSRFRSLISDFLGLAESARADGSQGQLILEARSPDYDRVSWLWRTTYAPLRAADFGCGLVLGDSLHGRLLHLRR